MNDAQMQARQQAIDYMVRLLQMNPIHEGEEIIHARGKALGLTNRTGGAQAAAVEEPQVDRRKVLNELEAIRSQFWTMPVDELKNKLSALDSQGFDDLDVAIGRLRIVAARRAQFPALAGMRGFDGDFFSALKEVLIRSPRDTAVLREKVISTFRNRSRRKSGRQMIALLKTEMPAIYQLEADWFDTLDRQKAQVPSVQLPIGGSSRSASVGSGSGVGNYWWVVGVVIMVAVRGMIAISDSSSRNSRPPSVPKYQLQNPQRYVPNDQRGFDTARQKELQQRIEEQREEVYERFKERGINIPDPNTLRPKMPSGYEPPTPDRFRSNSPSAPNVTPSPSFPQRNGRFQ